MERNLYQLQEEQDTYKIIIPELLEKKIRYVCRNIWNQEWSGVLFYDITGTFAKKNLVIKCIDFLLMDVGETAKTDYETNPEVMQYMVVNHLLDYKVGHIHSHNNMPTFFSSEDLSTLRQQGSYRDNFVSLIVNNKGEYTAAITRQRQYVMKINQSISEKDFNKPVKPIKKTIDRTETIIIWNYLKIAIEGTYAESDNAKELNVIIKELSDRQANRQKQIEAKFQEFRLPNNLQEESVLFPVANIPEIELDDTNPFTTEMIVNKVRQILTGNICNTTQLPLITLCANMEKVYNNRFTSSDTEEFISWADYLVELLCWHNAESMGPEYTDDYLSSICAGLILDKLKELPSNKYLEEFMKILKDY